MIYVVTFSISIILMVLSFKCKNNKILAKIITGIAIVIPCMLAGLRDISLGVDANIYIYPLLKQAIDTNDFVTFVFNNQMMNDYIYLAMTFFIAKIFKNIFWMFFMIQLLVILPVYKAIKITYTNNKQVLFGVLLIFLVLYNPAYNMARQSIALAFAILAFAYLDNKNEKKFYIFTIVALLFHWSAIIILLIYLLYKLINNKGISRNTKFVIKFAIIVVSIVIVILSPNLLQFLKYFGASQSKIEAQTGYILSKIEGNTTADTLFCIGIYILITIFRKYLIKDDEEKKKYDFYKYLLILGIITLQLGNFILYAHRIAYYFIYPVFFLEIPRLFSNSKNKITYCDFILILMFCFYWYFWTIIANYHDTFPYQFYNLN